MKDKFILITGATDGIGRSTAERLAQKGYSIILHGRNPDKLHIAQKEISKTTNNSNIHTIKADLSSLEDVSKQFQDAKNRFPTLYCLINNAGTYQKEKIITKEGFELTFVINHLSHFLLTQILLDNLKKGSPSRIINVSSIAHRNGKIEWDNLNAEKSFSPYGTYAFTKLANILFSNELANRLNPEETTVNSLHPGVITTKLLRIGFNMTGDTVESGSENSVYLASSDSVQNITGKYFVKLDPSPTNPSANDPNLQLEFWNKSMELIKSYLPVQ
jgi:NAD(P)-dependent dehydrogenase (short-subunit alcohol dehydrogenase family)